MPRTLPAFAALLVMILPGLTAPVVAQAATGKVKVEIEGISGEPRNNVEAVLQIAREAHGGKLSADRVERLHRKAESDINTALQPFGYYHVRVVGTLRRDGDDWTARYLIDAGPAVRVTSVNIMLEGEGADDSSFKRTVQRFPLHRGDTLFHERYQLGKLSFLNNASDSGYLKAKFDTAVILVDRTKETADITMKFDTGPRGEFGAVRWHQEREILDTSFLRTRVGFKRGDKFRHDKLLDLQTSLANDPYWAQVEVTPQADSMVGHEVPIDVTLVPRDRHANEFGVGYGTDTGPRGHVQSTWRYLNRQGHNAQITLDVGSIAQDIDATYKIPAFGSPTGILTFEAGYIRDNPKTSTSHIGKVRTSLQRTALGWQEVYSLAFQREAFVVGVDSAVSNLLIPGVSFTRTASDSKTYPTRGYRAQVDVQGSHDGVLANASFLQVHATAKGILGYSHRARVLVRGEIGQTFTSQFRTLPATIRYFTGGDQTVRGFGYQVLGPTDALGTVIGGPALIVGSLETDYRVFGNYGVAAFTDTGNALDKLRLSGLERSIGAGLRWISPFGMVRLDGAFAISRPGSPFRIHVSIGADL